MAAAVYLLAALGDLRAMNRVLEARVLCLSGDVDGVKAATADSLRRYVAVERQARLVVERVAAAETHSAGRSFDQAINAARRGSDAGKLAVRFGLSRGEADLVARLHGHAKVLK
jgi:hypothetical protein